MLYLTIFSSHLRYHEVRIMYPVLIYCSARISYNKFGAAHLRHGTEHYPSMPISSMCTTRYTATKNMCVAVRSIRSIPGGNLSCSFRTISYRTRALTPIDISRDSTRRILKQQDSPLGYGGCEYLCNDSRMDEGRDRESMRQGRGPPIIPGN